MRALLASMVPFLLFALLSCAKSDAIRPGVDQEHPQRAGMSFNPAIQLFSGDNTNPSIDGDNG